jgi:hypothetical protein
MGRKLSTFWCQLFRSILLYKEKERCLAFSDKNSSLSAKGRAYINLLSVDFAALILSALHIQRCGIILTSLSSFNPLLTVSLDFFIFFFLSQWKWTKEQSPNLSPEFAAQLSQEAAFILSATV